MGGVSTDQVDKTLSSSKRWHVAASATSLRSAQVAIQAMEISALFHCCQEGENARLDFEAAPQVTQERARIIASAKTV